MRAVSLVSTTSARCCPSFVMAGYRGEGRDEKGKEERADDQMPYVLAFALAMIFCAITLPRTSGKLPSLLYM